MNKDQMSEAMTYASAKPDVKALQQSYEQSSSDLSAYYYKCRVSYDDRRNWWPGKSRDLRKHGSDAFPWEGASDMESHVIDERITRLVSLMMYSLSHANIAAYPVEASDMAQAKVVGNFLKWMTSSGYIPRFKQEMELGANYLLERGILITYVGWHIEDRTFLHKLNIEQIAQKIPELAQAIQSGDNDQEIAALLMQNFTGVTEKRAMKALKTLRAEGTADLPMVKRQIDGPEVKTLAPDGDWIFPPYVTDPMRAPYGFWRTYMTAQELLGMVETDDWNPHWVDYIIEHHGGVDVPSVNRFREEGRTTESATSKSDLYEIIYGYQRLIDDEDGSEGIYLTVFHKEFSGREGIPDHAKHELQNGYEDYPVVITKLSEDSKRLYDVETLPSLLRGIQNQVKVERDSRIDRASLTTVPPIMHPVGNAPADWGPGRKIGYRRRGEIEFGPTPPPSNNSVEIEQTLQDQADRLVGLDEDSAISQIRKQFLVDKFLTHCAKVLGLAYRCFQRFGPDQVFFRVTGVADPQQFSKGDADENFDITINYDVLNTDPESFEKKMNQMVSLIQMDRNGRMDIDNLIEAVASSIDPVLADRILRPQEESKQKVAKEVTDDLAKIHAGIEVPARSNGAQTAIQMIQQYMKQPDIAEQLEQSEPFKKRLEKYMQQYVFSMQQAQNAQIGKIGTAPATMGGVDTQNMDAQ